MFNGIEGLTRESTKNDYLWIYTGVLTKEQAAEMQEKAGYHPAGYGFFHYTVTHEGTFWRCQKSCD